MEKGSMKKQTVMIIIGMLVVTSLSGVFSIETVRAQGTILYVGGSGPGNYTTIQEAINASQNGDTVFVYPGMYYKHIRIDKTINLIGAEKNTTIIDGNNERRAIIDINVDHVRVTGFTVQNVEQYYAGIDSFCNYSIIEGNIIRHCEDGIDILSRNIISHNTIIDCTMGIYIYIGEWMSSNENIIYENCIINCSTGVDGFWTSLNNISRNIIVNCGEGIHLGINGWVSDVYENTITQSQNYGIVIGGGYNRIFRNTIIDSAGVGLRMYGSNNQIHHNNFMNNAINAFGGSSNFWDDGYPSGGNYWSDYHGTDGFHGSGQNELGPDGIGDTSYVISGGIDHYPFMQINGWNTHYTLPENYTIIRGHYLSGGLPDLFMSDDSRLLIQSGETLGPFEPPVKIRAKGTTPIHAPQTINFTVEAKSLGSGITQTIELYNYINNSYELLDSRTSTVTDTRVTISIMENPSRFIHQTNGEMTVQLSWYVTGPILAWPFQVGIDQAIWTVRM
jgi:nitrous oxidase accessory protein NosD